MMNTIFEKLSFGNMLLFSYLEHITKLQNMINITPNWNMIIYEPNQYIIPLHFKIFLHTTNYQYAKYWIFDNNNLAANYHAFIDELKTLKLI